MTTDAEDPAGRAAALLERARALTEPVDAFSEDEPSAEALVESIGLLDEAVAACGPAPDATLHEHVATALYWKSQALFDLGRAAEALAVVDEMKRRISRASPEPSRRLLLRAMFMAAFSQRGDRAAAETAARICREAIALFEGEPDLWFRDWSLTLMVELGGALEFLERRDEGIALSREIAARFRDDTDETLRERAVRVAARLGETFGDTAR